MDWKDTVAVRCRYGDIAGEIWDSWDIVWEDSVSDYQGHASFLAKKGEKYCFYEWWYGSCSGCDGWEAADMTGEEIKAEMERTAMFFDNEQQLRTWLDMLQGNPISNYDMDRGGGLVAGLDLLSGGLLHRINGIRKHLGMAPLELTKKGLKPNGKGNDTA